MRRWKLEVEDGNVSGVILFPISMCASSYQVPSTPSSGDHDMCVPFTGSEAWTRSVGYKIVDEWRPWTSNGQVAGFTQGYDNNLTYLTIKGAGHTVPEYKPQEALDFYKRFITRLPL